MKNQLASRICLLAVLMIAAIATQGQTYTPLYTYPETDLNTTGIIAPGIMSQGQDGQLYTTNESNGITNAGTVFKMSLTGVPTTLYNFCSQSGCTDGSFPYGGVTLGFDGNLHGTTHTGGASAAGTVFKMTPAGKLTTQWSFDNLTDESVPYYPLLRGRTEISTAFPTANTTASTARSSRSPPPEPSPISQISITPTEPCPTCRCKAPTATSTAPLNSVAAMAWEQFTKPRRRARSPYCTISPDIPPTAAYPWAKWCRPTMETSTE